MPPEQFGGAVGQHLVDVHVGLRAGAGLPDDERELAAVAAGRHLVGRRHDGERRGVGQQAEFAVDPGAGALDLGQRADQFFRHAFAGNGEMLQRALRLRAPQMVVSYLDVAEGILLQPGHGGASVLV